MFGPDRWMTGNDDAFRGRSMEAFSNEEEFLARARKVVANHGCCSGAGDANRQETRFPPSAGARERRDGTSRGCLWLLFVFPSLES